MKKEKEIQVELDFDVDTTELEKYMNKGQIQAYIYVICKHINDRYNGKKVDKNFLTKLAVEAIKIFNIPDESLIGNLNNAVVEYMVQEKRKLRQQIVRKEKLKNINGTDDNFNNG